MSCGPHDVCITCGDVAVEMVVTGVGDARGLVVCTSENGEQREVETALVGAVAAGDRLLVHADVGLVRLEAESRPQDPGPEGPRR